MNIKLVLFLFFAILEGKTAMCQTKTRIGSTVPNFTSFQRKFTGTGYLLPPINQTVYTQHGKEKQPFFCEIESRVEKKWNQSFKFRLGSTEMVDYLEQKPNAKWPFK